MNIKLFEKEIIKCLVLLKLFAMKKVSITSKVYSIPKFFMKYVKIVLLK